MKRATHTVKSDFVTEHVQPCVSLSGVTYPHTSLTGIFLDDYLLIPHLYGDAGDNGDYKSTPKHVSTPYDIIVLCSKTRK